MAGGPQQNKLPRPVDALRSLVSMNMFNSIFNIICMNITMHNFYEIWRFMRIAVIFPFKKNLNDIKTSIFDQVNCKKMYFLFAV